ncbi:SH3 domain-containing protein, partial [Hansschlegelia beijingensis]
AVGHVGIRRAPGPDAPLETEALFGEEVTVYDELEGWSWLQLATDGYVGYAPSAALSGELGPGATHRVSALRTLLFPIPSIKAPPVDALSMNALASVVETDGISGRKSESVDRLGELVRGNPSESVAIIRQWLQEPA